MNIKTVTIASSMLLAVAVIVPLDAQIRQDNGFRIGPLPTQSPLATPGSPNPVQGMTTPPIQGMTIPPIMPVGGGIANSQTAIVLPQVLIGPGNSAINVLSPGGVIFVPAGTMVIESVPGMEPGAFLSAPAAPGTPATPAAPAAPSGARGRGTSIQRSDRSGANDKQASTKPDVTRLELGTPRDKVIEKYGNPVAFIMNMNGETLYFAGGVVVFVKNGVVASPGN